LYRVVADVFSLNTTMFAMGLATLTILPGSLTLKKHLAAPPAIAPESPV
jgi:hypothetical protein